MPTCLDQYWPIIIADCIKRIEHNDVAGIKSVIDALFINGTIPYSSKTVWYEEEIQTLAGQMTKSNEYIHFKGADDTYIFRNPNYPLFLSQIQTNKSFTKLNEEILPDNFKSQDKFNNRSILMAIITLLFVGATVVQQLLDKSEQELQGIRIQLQKTEKDLDSTRFFLKEINFSIEKLKKDTFPVKVHGMP